MCFRDLIGHADVAETLRAALVSGRLAHALMFVGPRGVGKATAALALASARLCGAPRDDGDACGDCATCRSVAHGNHPDLERVGRVIGKRDIGISQIRELLESIYRKPVSADGRVAIVDDAHRMTLEAQNALLKTLEEPPAGALLIVVTSSPERLLPTVVSRCARYRFRPLRESELTRYAATAELDLQGLPVSIARGSPGELNAWANGGLRGARDEMIRFLLAGPSGSPHELSARLLQSVQASAVELATDDDAKQDEREQVRERLLRTLRLLESLLRDVQVLASGGGEDLLYHRDCAGRLAELRDHDPVDLHAALLACDEGVLDLRRNVDPPLALEGVAARIQEWIGRREA